MSSAPFVRSQRTAASSSIAGSPVAPVSASPESLNPALLTRLAALESQLAQYKTVSKSSSSICLQYILRDADVSPRRTANRILQRTQHVSPQHPLLIPIARVCLTGAVGRVGARRPLRAVAIFLLDHLLQADPNNVQALCLKGEVLMSCAHDGYNDPFTPRTVLQEAYSLFTRASESKDILATFLKGRWLLCCEALHKDARESQNGRQLVQDAADKGCARALTYLAQRYDNPNFSESTAFAEDIPAETDERERKVLRLYIRAAKLGESNALNDIAASFASGYAGLPRDFEAAAAFYEAAIHRGNTLAYDNLGTHYETGMGGLCPDRVDYTKALYYYREGAKKRCPKCAYNLGAAYEEGLKGVLNRDVNRAEKYYVHSLRLADDAHDAQTATRTLRDLIGLYLTRIKLDEPDGADGLTAARRLKLLVGEQNVIDRTLLKLNSAIGTALRSKTGRCPILTDMVGDYNAKSIINHAKEVERRVRAGGNAADVLLYHHLAGTTHPNNSDDASGAKRRRGSSRRVPANGGRKRRKN